MKYRLPESIADWTFDTYPKDAPKYAERMAFMQRWLETDKWLILLGTVGSGKTGLAVSAYKVILDSGIHGVFWRMSLLLDGAKGTFDNGGQNPIEPLRTGCKLVVLDDVGAERGTEWAIATVADLITARYDRKLRTIITTNLTMDKFTECYGERVRDRLGEVAEALILTGRSLRPQLKAYQF
ncbi:MAG: ATP-binding protein [Sphaerochaeta sp.]|jgi:DNA replication protein DnaC|nr:ATP-binding protein [Sphaerochaeta sp.]